MSAFIDFRKEVVLKRSKYLYEKMQKRCHVLEGLMKAVSILDEVIAVIRASKDKADAKKNLCEKFYFTEDDKKVINKVFDFESMKSMYNPDISDNVKNLYNKDTVKIKDMSKKE